eukprot:SAG11_NODE_1683_length_4450_cov_2.569984_3_plen_403_part_00
MLRVWRRYDGVYKKEPAIQCGCCEQWFFLQDLAPNVLPPGYLEFQLNVKFQCKLCASDNVETCEFSKPTWFLAIQSAMQHLMWTTQREKFKVKELQAFLLQHWDSLCWGFDDKLKEKDPAPYFARKRAFFVQSSPYWALKDLRESPDGSGPPVQPCPLLRGDAWKPPPEKKRKREAAVSGAAANGGTNPLKRPKASGGKTTAAAAAAAAAAAEAQSSCSVEEVALAKAAAAAAATTSDHETFSPESIAEASPVMRDEMEAVLARAGSKIAPEEAIFDDDVDFLPAYIPSYGSDSELETLSSLGDLPDIDELQEQISAVFQGTDELLFDPTLNSTALLASTLSRTNSARGLRRQASACDEGDAPVEDGAALVRTSSARMRAERAWSLLRRQVSAKTLARSVRT